jgi:sterol desaturase/sphingolipid hydroxylase (fatty acid hydroxylase superfamily)
MYKYDDLLNSIHEHILNTLIALREWLHTWSILDALGVLFLTVLGLCIYLEARNPVLTRQARVLMKSYPLNLSTFFFNDLTASLLSLSSVYYLADAVNGHGLLVGMENGPLKYILCFILLDFTMYAWHYLMHHCDVLWVLHRVHHSDPNLNVTTGLRFHFGELLLEVMVRTGFILAMGITVEFLLVTQAVMSLFILFHHTNTRLPGERYLALIFIVPRLHRAHHSTLRSEHDSNYGAVFSVWDRLFHTLREVEPEQIGIEGWDEPGFLGMVKSCILADFGWAHKMKTLPVPIRKSQE